MNTYQFVEKVGVSWIEQAIKKGLPQYNVFCICVDCGWFGISEQLKVNYDDACDNYCPSCFDRNIDDFDTPELEQVIADFELVEKLGGLDSCKKKLSTRLACKPKATHFAMHPEANHLIQLYYRNEPKLVPNYRFIELQQAIQRIEEGLNDA